MKIPINNITKIPTVILNFILDESGSMDHQRQNVIGGFNEYIATMKSKADAANYYVNLIKFGDKTEFVFTNKALADVRKLTTKDYNPQYSTALRDGIGNTILLTERQMSESHPGATTLFYVFTDGAENASREFTGERLNEMITSRENKGGWTITFIGADKECLQQAHQWGISWGNTITYNAKNFTETIVACANATETYTSNLTSGVYANAMTRSLFQDAGYDNSKNLDEQSDGTLGLDTTTKG